MTKERVCANSPAMSRRTLMTALPVAGVAMALPGSTFAQDRGAILEVIRELEECQGWEMSCVIAAKLYAAHIMREALDLETPHTQDAWRHIEYQGEAFERYSQTVWFERDKAEGKKIIAPRPSL